MKILSLLSGILLFIVFNGFSQTGVGDYQSGFKTEGNTVSLTDQNAELRIEFCTPAMVRIRANWDKTFDPPEQWMVAKYDWPSVDIQTSDEGDHFLLSTDQLSIYINKAPFSIRIYTSDGQLLNSEVLNSGKGGMYKEDNSVMCLKKLMTGEHFFGFGERMDFLDRRGKMLKLNVGRGEGMPHIIGAYNILKANYCPVPFFMSTEGYGIFFHNAYPTTWDMGNTKNDSIFLYSGRRSNGLLLHLWPWISYHYGAIHRIDRTVAVVAGICSGAACRNVQRWNLGVRRINIRSICNRSGQKIPAERSSGRCPSPRFHLAHFWRYRRKRRYHF